MVGMPECDVLLGQCAVYLAKAPKSRSVYNALRKAEKVILEHKGSQPAVPSHMKCNSTQLQSEIGNTFSISLLIVNFQFFCNKLSYSYRH